MQVLRPDRDLEALFHAVSSRGRRPLLLLDYDGTLAPFHKERDRAVPYPGVTQVLADLLEAGRTRVVLVSGRSVRDIPPLLRMDPLPEIWGSHGWERLRPDGAYSIEGLGAAASDGLAAATTSARENAGPEQLEIKPVSVALHFRGIEPALEESLRAAVVPRWTAIAKQYGLQMHSFDGGVELRVPGRDKGHAVRSLLEEMGSETPTAYLGDDATDEDAFAALNAAGFGVLVRPEYRATRADIWLRPPDELLQFLHRWRAADRAG